MKNFTNIIAKEFVTIAKGSLLALLLIGGFAFAADFTQPSQSPPGGNVDAPVNVGATAQSKAGSFAAIGLAGINVLASNKVISQDRFCFREGTTDDCITAWPDGNGGGDDFSTTCQINSMIIHGTDDSRAQWGVPHAQTGYVNSSDLGSLCDSRLTAAERTAGWMNVSFDNCPGVQGQDCSGVSYCQYIQLQCQNGITVGQGTTSKQAWNASGRSGAPNPGGEVPGGNTRTTNPFAQPD